MSITPIPFDFETVDKAKGCPHGERAKNRGCEHCGSQLCYECTFEDVIGKRTGATTSIDKSTLFSHATFCASCFLKRTREPNYNLYFQGSLFPDASMKPIKPTLGRITNMPGDYFYMFFAILLFPLIFGPVMYGFQYFRANKAYGDYEFKFNKACSVINQIQSAAV